MFGNTIEENKVKRYIIMKRYKGNFIKKKPSFQKIF